MFYATVGKLKFSHIQRDFIISCELKQSWDIWHLMLNCVGHQDRGLKTHEPGIKGITICKAHMIHVLW